MKISALAFALLLGTFAHSQTYYWVGDAGNWSDLSHWATTSGGATLHTELPTLANDVVFDENSFTTTGQIVQIDLDDVSCRDFIISNTQFSPHLNSNGFYHELHVNGNLNMDNSMTRNLNFVIMEANAPAQINTGDIQLGLFGFLSLQGDGPFYLNDSLIVANFYVYGGDFYSNGNAVHAPQRINVTPQPDATVDFATSNIHTNMWDVSSNFDLNMAQATLNYGSEANIFNDFNGGGHHYHHVIFTGEVELTGNNTYDLFEAMPGSELLIQEGSTQAAGQFELVGTSALPITIGSTTNGAAAHFEQLTGSVEGYFLNIRDNHASGGAAFTAYNSIDLGNLNGWMLEELQPQTYYWVGGSGDWSDTDHWATTSGGSTYHNWPPMAIDDVVFDANSFTASGGTVDLGNAVLNCKNLLIADLAGPAVFGQVPGGKLNVYGSLDMEEGPNYQLQEIAILALEPSTIDFHDALLGQQSHVVVAADSEVVFLSGFTANKADVETGTVNMAGQHYDIEFEFMCVPAFSGVLNMSNASFRARSFGLHGNMAGSNIEGLDLTITSMLHGYDQAFDQVTIEGVNLGNGVILSGGFTANNLTIEPGSIAVFDSGEEYIVSAFTLVGTEAEPIEIVASTEGVAATFVKGDGVVEGEWLVLRDNHATGGAEFNALNSMDLGNTDGWNISPPDSGVGIVQAQLQAGFLVYPNPAQEQIWFTADIPGRLEIVDQLGRRVVDVPVSEGRQFVGLEGFANGGYIARYITSVGVQQCRFICH